MKKNYGYAAAAVLLSLFCTGSTVSGALAEDLTEAAAESITEETSSEQENRQNYQLEKMVVFSRHNMRAPTKSSGSLMTQLTPYEWTDYTAPNGDLTLLGGTQETAMGQYFRKYLIDKGLIEEDWIPEENEVRFYANSYQRTITTARYFLTGMLPLSDEDVEYHVTLGEMDPVFTPGFHYISDEYLDQIQEEMDALANGTGMQGYMAQYADDIALLEDTLDFADSEYALENNLTSIPMETTTITYTLGEEPKASGGLKIANSAADALIMQYYAEPDLQKASFGRDLSWDQWCSIGNICSMYTNLLFGLPSVAVNVSNLLLKELKSEMTDDDRVFSFLCGHDSNLLPLLVSLGVEDLSIEENICKYTPIGCKLVFEKYLGEDGEDYAAVSLVYQNSESLRDNKLITLDNPPVWLDLSLSGLEKNSDGLYRWDDVLARFDEKIEVIDQLSASEETVDETVIDQLSASEETVDETADETEEELLSPAA